MGSRDSPGKTRPMIAVLLVLALVLALVAASCRYAAADERVVVSRRGRPVRVGRPGLVLIWPLLERTRTVSLEPTEIPLVAHGISAEGAQLVLVATLRLRVSDPSRSPDPTDPGVAFADVAERYVGAELAGLTVDSLRTDPDQVLAELEADLAVLAARHGVVLEDLLQPEFELRLGGQ